MFLHTHTHRYNLKPCRTCCCNPLPHRHTHIYTHTHTPPADSVCESVARVYHRSECVCPSPAGGLPELMPTHLWTSQEIKEVFFPAPGEGGLWTFPVCCPHAGPAAASPPAGDVSLSSGGAGHAVSALRLGVLLFIYFFLCLFSHSVWSQCLEPQCVRAKMMDELSVTMCYDAHSMEQMSEEEILACLVAETGPTFTVRNHLCARASITGKPSFFWFLFLCEGTRV